MYCHPAWVMQRADDQAAERAACVLVRLRAEAAERVPEWTPEMREALKEVYRKHRSSAYY
jgi:hypothetical protein